MLLLGEYDPSIETTLGELNRHCERIEPLLPQFDEVREFSVGEALDSFIIQDTTSGDAIRVDDGLVYAQLDNRVIYVLQPGDFIGFDHYRGGPRLNYHSENGCRLQRFNHSTLREAQHVSTDLLQIWEELKAMHLCLFLRGFGRYIGDEHRPQAGFIRFKPDETILVEGDQANDVYTLLRGNAKVLVKGELVGQIHTGEIFGAIAALTQTTRNATVIAVDHCTIMAVPKNQFAGILRAHPNTAIQLMESMARTINDLNERLIGRNRES